MDVASWQQLTLPARIGPTFQVWRGDRRVESSRLPRAAIPYQTLDRLPPFHRHPTSLESRNAPPFHPSGKAARTGWGWDGYPATREWCQSSNRPGDPVDSPGHPAADRYAPSRREPCSNRLARRESGTAAVVPLATACCLTLPESHIRFPATH